MLPTCPPPLFPPLLHFYSSILDSPSPHLPLMPPTIQGHLYACMYSWAGNKFKYVFYSHSHWYTVRRGVGGMCSRLLAGLFCLSRVFTPTAPEDDSFRRGEGDKQRSKFVWNKEKKKRKKHPRTTAKHSALKQARFPCVACCYQRDKKQNRGMSVSATRSGMRWSVSWLDELTSPNILYQVCMREKAEQCPGFWLFCWFSKCLNF